MRLRFANMNVKSELIVDSCVITNLLTYVLNVSKKNLRLLEEHAISSPSVLGHKESLWNSSEPPFIIGTIMVSSEVYTLNEGRAFE